MTVLVKVAWAECCHYDASQLRAVIIHSTGMLMHIG